MFLLDDCLFRLWRTGLCEKEDVLLRAQRPLELSDRILQVERGVLADEYDDDDDFDDDEDDDDEDDDDDDDDRPRRRLSPSSIKRRRTRDDDDADD